MSWGETARADNRPLTFPASCNSSNTYLLVSSSQLPVWCEIPFWSSPQNRVRNSRPSLHRLWLGVQLSYLPPSRSQRVAHYFHLWCRRVEHPFPVVLHLRRKFGTHGFFPVISNYRSHSLMTGWPVTSGLAWLTQGSTGNFVDFRSAFSFYYFFFFSVSFTPEISPAFSAQLQISIMCSNHMTTFLNQWHNKMYDTEMT